MSVRGPVQREHLFHPFQRAASTPMGGSAVVSHGLTRPTWRCLDCGQAWPCASKRYRLLAEFQGAPTSLYLYMAMQLVDAAKELAPISAGDLHTRFIGWIGAHRHNQPGELPAFRVARENETRKDVRTMSESERRRHLDPIYQQTADELRTAIREGRYAAGSPLPPERTLAKRLGVSRDSVREAVRLLVEEGLVAKSRGNPSVVSAEPVREEIVLPAQAVVTVRMPSPRERELLGIEPGEIAPIAIVHSPDRSDVMYAGNRAEFRARDLTD